MLIIPFDRPLDWRRPPVATLLLVLANVLVYFGLQLDDTARLRDAVVFYYEGSALADLELPRYRDYLVANGERGFVEEWEDALQDPASPWLFRMLGDGPFMADLRAGEVITADHPDFATWQAQRQRFDRLIGQSTVMAWGLKPAELSPGTWVSHMFLHGGIGHLLGNMFFLVAVGFLVEMTLGAAAFAGLYVLGGLGAAGLFVVMNLQSAIPMVGASGAIAGLMGMYAVIYGLRRINFFYWVIVYFDYIKAPAIALLPLWLANELFQYFSAGGESSVAYMAHVGGLVTGAGLAFGYKHLGPGVDEDFIAEKERSERFQADLETVESALRALAPERAAAALKRLQQQAPEDSRVLSAAYRAHRFTPDAAEYHQAAQALLTAGGGKAVGQDVWLWVYRDYLKRARPKPRLSKTLVEIAADRLLHFSEHRDAARLVGIMTAHPDRFPAAADHLLRLANVTLRQGEQLQAADYYRKLRTRFPDSEAARVAGRQLASLSL